MRMYFSGWQATNAAREEAVLKEGNISDRCFSYAMIQKLPGLPFYIPNLQGAYDMCRKYKVGIMMDSGVHSWRTYYKGLLKSKNEKGLAKLLNEKDFIASYVKYVRAHQSEWDFYFTVDMEKIAADNYRRHKLLMAEGPDIVAVPVFHGDDNAETYIKKYADLGIKFIGLAFADFVKTNQKRNRQYLASCFNAGAKYGIEFHGLAATSVWQMMEFPWYSVDSSSWSRVAGFGSIMMYDQAKRKMQIYHISDRESAGKGAGAKHNSRTVDYIREHLKQMGYDYGVLAAAEGEEAFIERHKVCARAMAELTADATKKHSSSNAGRFSLLFA